MGFLITGSVFNTTQGEYDCLYGRIDGYIYSRSSATLTAIVVLHIPSESENHIVEFPINNSKPSTIIGVELEKNGETIQYPLSVTMPVTSSTIVNVPVYQNFFMSQSINYYEVDESGNKIEKNKLEYKNNPLIVAVEEIEQDILNTEVLTGNVFPFMYTVVTERYKEIFGEENIINI